MTQPKYKFKDLVKDGKATVSGTNNDQFKIKYKQHDTCYGTLLTEEVEEIVDPIVLGMEIKRLQDEMVEATNRYKERIEWLQDQIDEIKKVDENG